MSTFSSKAASERLAQIDRERADFAEDEFIANPDSTPELLAALDRERVCLVELIRAMQEYERVAVPYPRPDLHQRHRPGTKSREIAKVVEDLIAKLGRPIHTREVAHEVAIRGVLRFVTSDSSVTTTHLSHLTSLKKHPFRGWWPVDWPWPGIQG